MLVAASFASGCGTPRVLAPRQPPSRRMPVVQMPAEPPAQGHGRVVIDVVDGPMDVSARTVESFAGAGSGPPRSGPLCRTPCAVDLPLGRYKLYLSGLRSDPSRGDAVDLDVHPGLNVLRRASGKYETPEYMPTLPIVLIVGGGVGVVGGGATLATGNGAAGAILMGLGLALSLGGAIAWPRRAEQQQGRSTFWNEPPQPIPAAEAQPAPAPAPIFDSSLAPPASGAPTGTDNAPEASDESTRTPEP
ncbi:MAG: hypothetical protein OEZ06_05630 [Myxococcales bacterium]|nr:hypothetical protein [Myxococcales bacterium]